MCAQHGHGSACRSYSEFPYLNARKNCLNFSYHTHSSFCACPGEGKTHILKEFRHFISFIGLPQKNFTQFLSSIRDLIVFESRN
jgi:hypothetical protein